MSPDVKLTPEQAAVVARLIDDPDVPTHEGREMPDASTSRTISHRLPADDELRAATLPHWEAVRPFLLSTLPPAVMSLTMPTLLVSVPTADVIAHWLPAFDGKGGASAAETLLRAGRSALESFPDGFFFKLDTRSPKDCGVTRYAAGNLHLLPHDFFSSERMLDDLCAQRFHRDAFVLCFREWVDLVDEQRVFVKGGRIQGVTRYDYFTPARDCDRVAGGAMLALAEKYLALLAPHVAVPDYVFDFGFLGDGRPTLIELNPYGLSDPCCFVRYDRIEGYACERMP